MTEDMTDPLVERLLTLLKEIGITTRHERQIARDIADVREDLSDTAASLHRLETTLRASPSFHLSAAIERLLAHFEAQHKETS